MHVSFKATYLQRCFCSLKCLVCKLRASERATWPRCTNECCRVQIIYSDYSNDNALALRRWHLIRFIKYLFIPLVLLKWTRRVERYDENFQCQLHSLLVSWVCWKTRRTPKMSLFVSLLSPIIRVCQYSGLSPLDLDRGTAFSTKNRHSYAIIMAIWLAIEIGHFVNGLALQRLYSDWERSKILSCINLVTPLFIRLHVIVVLIESFQQRSAQVEFLDKITEIERYLTMHFHVQIDDVRLQREFRNLLIFWLFRIGALIMCACMVSTWGTMYYVFLYIVPLYTSTLLYVQFLAYIGTIRYCVDVLNVEIGQFSMSDVPPGSVLGGDVLQTFVVSFDKISRLTKLREAYQMIWHASALINQCVRWSLPLGVNNEFITLINALYWIVSLCLDPLLGSPRRMQINVIWSLINLSHLFQLSDTCERLAAEVSVGVR